MYYHIALKKNTFPDFELDTLEKVLLFQVIR